MKPQKTTPSQKTQMGSTLPPKELARYRQWLTELNEEAHKPGGNLKSCEPWIESYFDPRLPIGGEIYHSFSNDELLEIMIREMDHYGHKPDWDNFYCIYKLYLRRRFGSLPKARAKALKRLKFRKNAERWPPDWPERVSVEPLLEWSNKRQRPFTEEEIALFRRLADTARETGLPPEMTREELAILDQFGNRKIVLNKMGIPYLPWPEMREMLRYWKAMRAGEPFHEP